VLSLSDHLRVDEPSKIWYEAVNVASATSMKLGTSSIVFRPEMGFFTSSSIIFAGSFVVNVLNYIFTLVVSRILGVEEFGQVASLLSLFLLITVPATALSMLMARETAFHKEHGPSTLEHLFAGMQKHSALAALALWVFFLALAPLIADFLNISLIPLVIFSLVAPLNLIGALQAGTLQGLQEFVSLSIQNILGAIIKLAASIVLVAVGFSVAGVMGALVLASACSLAYGYVATRSLISPPVLHEGSSTPPASMRIGFMNSFFGSILITTALLALLSNVDVLLAKHYLPADMAGEYGALSTVGKIIIYGIGAFISALLPMASAANARGNGEERGLLWLSLASVFFASLAAVVVFSLFPQLVVSILFGGTKYSAIAGYLGMFSIAMGCISLSTTFINYFVATRNTSFVYPLAISIVTEIVLIAQHHDSIMLITQVLVYSSTVLLALMVANYVLVYRGRLII